jgi:hypothetical protein
MTYVNAPFMKKILHITERKRKTNIHHYCKSDDFRAGFKIAKWRMFCHWKIFKLALPVSSKFTLTIPGMARRAWLGPRNADRAKPSNAN